MKTTVSSLRNPCRFLIAANLGSLGFGLISTGGRAQTAPAPAGGGTAASDVTDLGPFIVSEAPAQRFANGNVDFPRGINDAQPYYIYQQTDLLDSEATTVEEFLKKELPMDQETQTNSQTFGFGIGTVNSINLRGLGAGQTLVLVNGRRLQGVDQINSNVYGNQPDINAIPAAAISRIEVLPSNASAIYGPSAAGGMINIILNRNYNGGQISYTYGNPFNSDAPIRRLDASLGISKGKLDLMVAASYSDQKPILSQDQLDTQQRSIAIIKRNNPALLFPSGVPIGSTPNIQLYPGVVAGFTNPQTATLTLKDGTSLNSTRTFIPPGTSPSTASATLASGLLANAGSFNNTPDTSDGDFGLRFPLTSVSRLKSLIASLTYHLTPNIDLDEEFTNTSNIGLEGYNHIYKSMPGSTSDYLVPGNAPDNPFGENVLVHFPVYNNETLQTQARSTAITSAINVHIPTIDWNAELDYTWSSSAHYYNHEADNDDTQLAPLFANGTLNPFVDTSAYPLNVNPYVLLPTYSGLSYTNDLALRGSGKLFSLPWGQPTLSVGLEHRLVGFEYADTSLVAPLAPAEDSFHYYFGQNLVDNSAYAESFIPVVTPKNSWGPIRTLDFQVAVRSEWENQGVGTTGVTIPASGIPVLGAPQTASGGYYHTSVRSHSTNPTLAVRYSPADGFLIRASYSTAFIPATLSQLTPSLSTAPITTITDPANGQTYQTNFSTGGNPNLKPQTSRDWDFGIVWEPQAGAWKGLRLDAEYFDIKEKNVITNLTAQQTVSDPDFAYRVTRSPTTGLITFIDLSYLNLFSFHTDGWDFSAAYVKTTGFGKFRIRSAATWTPNYLNTVTLGSPAKNYAGFPSFGGPVKLKANGTLTWEISHLRLGWTTLFTGSYGQYGAPNSPLYTSPSVALNTLYTSAQGSTTVASQVYHNVFAAYDFDGVSSRSLLKGVSVKVTVDDVFNAAPPFDAYYAPFFYSPFGDVRQRSYLVTLTKAF